jgi:hypothetical protein
MRRHRRLLALGLGLSILSQVGCHGALRGNDMAFQDAPLGDPGMIGEARPVTFADRHPLLYKPVEWYDRAAPNPILGVASATFVGIPAGALGEARQIIMGCPVRP